MLTESNAQWRRTCKLIVLKEMKNLTIYFHLLLLILNIYSSNADEFCGKPPEIKNATPILEDFTNVFPIGANISYTCDEGYALNTNGTNYAVCLNNSETAFWQPATVSCISVCNFLPSLSNGRIVKDQEPPYMPGESVRFVCDSGYLPNTRNSKITCILNDNGVANWTQTDGICKITVVSCNDPGFIENASRVGSDFTFPNSITYVCEEGYKLIGTATRYCSPKGQWVPNSPPLCQIIVCPSLSDPLNGKVISSQRKLHAVAAYQCNRYFNLSGNHERICQEDGTWSGVRPTCKEIICYDPGALQYVRVLPTKEFHKAGDLVIFQCRYGSEQISSKCLETGEWSKRPPLCPGPETTETSLISTVTTKTVSEDPTSERKVSCDDPGKIKNGERTFVGLSINSTVSYTCDDGYELRGKGTLLCMENGKWNLDKLPICVKPLSVPSILGIVFGVLSLVAILVGGYFLYRWREKKLRGYGKKSKALTADATDLEEIAGLEKGKKPIPVTVL